jgi:uncharacterized SAM-binding protein YcdF (DUF218 family)
MALLRVMSSLNDVLQMLELGSLKGLIASIIMPPTPWILLSLLGAFWLRKKRLTLGWAAVWAGALMTWFSCTTLLGSALIDALLKPPPALSAGAVNDLKTVAAEQKTAIIVLGGGRDAFAPEYGVSNLNATSMERLRYGVWLSQATGPPLGFTGGVGFGAKEGATEAEVAGRIAAAEFGRPLRWLESQSRDTSENAQYTVTLLRAAGVERVVVVTHGYHMRRAVAAFQRVAARTGTPMAIVPAPMGLAVRSRGWLPTAEGLMQNRMAWHEWLGWLAGA